MSVSPSSEENGECHAAFQDFQELDAVCEAHHNSKALTKNKLLTALEIKRPGSLARRQVSIIERLRTSSGDTEPGDTYIGPRMHWPLTDQDVIRLVLHYCKDGHCPIYEGYLYQILSKSIDMFSRMEPVTHIKSCSDNHFKLVVVGDLHGQLQDLFHIFLEHGFPNPDGVQYLFNGDFVDRGTHSIEVITILLAFKLLYPNSVHLNRGNHEEEMVNMDFGFHAEVMAKYPGSLIFHVFATLWNQLPLATVIDETVLVVHGGLFSSSGVTLKHINSIPKQDCGFDVNSFYDRLRRDCLWSDPGPEPGITQGKRGDKCIEFGPDITQDFLDRNHLTLLIRSHQVPSNNEGFEWLHGNRVITVFSASNYCGAQGNFGGVVTFTNTGEITCTEYYAEPLEALAKQLTDLLGPELTTIASTPSSGRSCFSVISAGSPMRSCSNFSGRSFSSEAGPRARRVVLNHLRDLIKRRSVPLGKFWAGCPEVQPGRISRDDWFKGLKTVLELTINWAAYERALLPVADILDRTVDWRAFLAQYKVRLADGQQWWVQLRRDLCDRLESAVPTLGGCLKLLSPASPTTSKGNHVQEVVNSWLGFGITYTQVEDIIATLCPSGCSVQLSSLLQGLHMVYRGEWLSMMLQDFVWSFEKLLAERCHDTLETLTALDYNGDGKFSAVALRQFLLWMSRASNNQRLTSPDLCQDLIEAFDEKQTGTLNLSQFLSNFKPSAGPLEKIAEVLAQDITQTLEVHKGPLQVLLNHLDADAHGRVTSHELQDGLVTLVETLDVQLTQGEVELVVKHLDKEKDGTIDCKKFLDTFTVLQDASIWRHN